MLRREKSATLAGNVCNNLLRMAEGLLGKRGTTDVKRRGAQALLALFYSFRPDATHQGVFRRP